MNHSQYKILNTAAVFSLGVVLLVMVIQWIAAPAYRIGNHDLLEKTGREERWILPHDLHRIVSEGQMEQYLLIDLRQTEAFNSGTLPGAVNIPFENLLDSKYQRILRADKPMMLFSGNESLTAVAGMMLYSKGFDQVYLLANDYVFVKENVLDGYVPASAMSKGEKARFDYNRYFETSSKSSTKTSKQQPVIIETEVIQAAGGC
ncbi:MAG: rhodanese-like domain-containing protein [Bacteroidales bacterium]